jgi:hypothetical protein
VGNAQNIKIWGANWLPHQAGFKFCNPMSILGVDALASELIDEDLKKWKSGLINQIFNSFEAQSLVFLSLGASRMINNFGIVKKMVISRSAQLIICKQLKESYINLKCPLPKVISGERYGRLMFPTRSIIFFGVYQRRFYQLDAIFSK